MEFVDRIFIPIDLVTVATDLKCFYTDKQTDLPLLKFVAAKIKSDTCVNHVVAQDRAYRLSRTRLAEKSLQIAGSSTASSSSTMPEIAEVERARTILEQTLKDQTIIDVEAVDAFLALMLTSSLMMRLSSKTQLPKILPLH